MEFQDREGRNDSLKLEFENYLKRERTEKRKKTKGRPAATSQFCGTVSGLPRVAQGAVRLIRGFRPYFLKSPFSPPALNLLIDLERELEPEPGRK